MSQEAPLWLAALHEHGPVLDSNAQTCSLYVHVTTHPSPNRAARHQAVLDDLIDLGHELARLVVGEAKSGATSPANASKAFDRTIRSVRRCIFLAGKLDEPVRPAIDRVAARKRIIRDVEDAIQRDTHGQNPERLTEELRERLDSPDLEDAIDDNPVDDIIRDLLRDLGLAHIPGAHHPWKRRTPADITDLNARAAHQPAPIANPISTPNPQHPIAAKHHDSRLTHDLPENPPPPNTRPPKAAQPVTPNATEPHKRE